MNHASPVILIIGGGVAGMAAARALDRQDVQILLVEKRKTLGGHAADWACMATDTCANCGACLSIEMMEQTAKQANIQLFPNNQIQNLTRTDDGFNAGLASGETVRADKIILATGFSPFDPVKLPSLQPGDRSQVITTAQLNTLLREESLKDRFKGNPAPRIAFIQCVGSRNRELGNDYCSQVCCRVSLRHAGKLLDLIPDAGITLFYMDLQVIGKETRTMARSLAGKVNLVQGVPAEILENPETGTLSMVLEDPGTRQRIKQEFDLVVLSVGMEPSENLDQTAELLGISPNPWGFFQYRPCRAGRRRLCGRVCGRTQRYPGFPPGRVPGRCQGAGGPGAGDPDKPDHRHYRGRRPGRGCGPGRRCPGISGGLFLQCPNPGTRQNHAQGQRENYRHQRHDRQL